MKISIISSSQRPKSQTLKVCNYLQTKLNEQNIETFLYDLESQPLAFTLTKYLAEEEIISQKSNERLQVISKEFIESDGFIFATPEWNGTASPALLNLLVHLSISGKNELAHKPVLLVTVSSNKGGAMPIDHLRFAGYKNNLYNVIPEHIIVRDANNVLNSLDLDEGKDSSDDLYLKKRINFSLDVLLKYADALKLVRKNGIPLFEISKNGMS
jgi:NAD(P)H-dependent FMN reductase